MDSLTIPIPDGLAEEQKADLRGWFADLARQAAGVASTAESDPAFRAEACRRIKHGMAEIADGRGVDGIDALRAIAAKHGLNLPR